MPAVSQGCGPAAQNSAMTSNKTRDQWYYELQRLNKLFLDNDKKQQEALVQASLDTAWVLEQARRFWQTGIKTEGSL